MVSLQTLRLDRGLTLAQLSELSGLSVGRIGNWEAWNRSPRPKSARDPLLMSVKSARALAVALGVTLDTLSSSLAATEDVNE